MCSKNDNQCWRRPTTIFGLLYKKVAEAKCNVLKVNPEINPRLPVNQTIQHPFLKTVGAKSFYHSFEAMRPKFRRVGNIVCGLLLVVLSLQPWPGLRLGRPNGERKSGDRAKERGKGQEESLSPPLLAY